MQQHAKAYEVDYPTSFYKYENINDAMLVIITQINNEILKVRRLRKFTFS